MIKIWKKSLKITKNLIGKIIYVYNGCKFIKLTILNEMVGFRFGEFLKTKIVRHNFSKKGKLEKKKNKKK